MKTFWRGVAAAAVLVGGSGCSAAKAAEVLRVQGVWGAQGDHAAASASTGYWLPPGDYIVKWFSPQPFGDESHWADDFEVRQHYETWDGQVLFDFVGGDTIDPIYLPIGARSWTTRLAPNDYVRTDPQGFYREEWREAATVYALAGPEAIGRPFTFSVSTVPEPPAWTLAIGGLLVAGAVLRRRRMTAAS